MHVSLVLIHIVVVGNVFAPAQIASPDLYTEINISSYVSPFYLRQVTRSYFLRVTI